MKSLFLAFASAVLAWCIFIPQSKAQIFQSADDTAVIVKRAQGLGLAQMHQCEKGLAARYHVDTPKIVKWAPTTNVAFYRKAGGWPGGSRHRRYENSLIIMGARLDSETINLVYGAPQCIFGREGGRFRFLVACAVGGRLSGVCRVPS